MSIQNEIEMIQDRLQRGLINADEANVQMIRAQRFRLIRGSMPASARRSLNAAVKRGELGHMKRDGKKPECYYHPTFDYLASAERSRVEQEAIRAITKVAGFSFDQPVH